MVLKKSGLLASTSVASLLLLGPALNAQDYPQFEAAVARVRVDVIAVDEQGRFVGDLVAEDFLLYEDGVPQKILGIQLVDLVTGTTPRAAAFASVPGEGLSRVSGSVPPRGTADCSVRTALGALVFVIDAASLESLELMRFVGAWNAVLEQAGALRVPWAAYLLGGAGGVEELVPLTCDAAQVGRATERVRVAAAPYSGVGRNLLEVARDMGRDTPGVQMRVRALEFEERTRSLTTLGVLTRFANAVAARPGRTALVWVSAGVKLTAGGPFAALVATRREMDPSSRGLWSADFDILSPDPQLVDLHEELVRAANSANVSIYAVDPTPWTELRGIGSDVEVRTPREAQLLSSSLVQMSLEGLRDALRWAAEETAGEAFLGWADLGRALRRIEEDAGRFYLLTYAVPEPVGDGEYHEIRVEVRRPGVRVRARRGYLDLGPGEWRERVLAAALALPGMVVGLPVRVEAHRRWSVEGEPVVELVVGTEGKGPLGVHVVVGADDRVVKEVHRGVRGRGERSSPGPLVYVEELALAPGRYEVRVAVEEEGTGRLGAAALELEVPEPSGGWRSSDLMLMVAEEGGQPRPLVGGRVVEGRQVLAYVEVAGAREPALSGALFSGDGSRRLAPLPEVPLRADGAGIHRGALRLQGLPPGHYTLQLLIADAPAQKHQFFRTPLQVLPAPGAQPQGEPGV